MKLFKLHTKRLLRRSNAGIFYETALRLASPLADHVYGSLPKAKYEGDLGCEQL